MEKANILYLCNHAVPPCSSMVYAAELLQCVSLLISFSDEANQDGQAWQDLAGVLVKY